MNLSKHTINHLIYCREEVSNESYSSSVNDVNFHLDCKDEPTILKFNDLYFTECIQILKYLKNNLDSESFDRSGDMLLDCINEKNILKHNRLLGLFVNYAHDKIKKDIEETKLKLDSYKSDLLEVMSHLGGGLFKDCIEKLKPIIDSLSTLDNNLFDLCKPHLEYVNSDTFMSIIKVVVLLSNHIIKLQEKITITKGK